MARQPLNRTYLWMVILLMFVLPIISIFFEAIAQDESVAWIRLTGKWFIFWAIGLRLLTAGLRQVLTPSFTAQTVFRMKTNESHIIIRELGFSNICMGTLGILSIFVPEWREAAAFVGGLYMGIAGGMHVFKRLDGPNEAIALVSDLWVFAIMLVYLSSAR
ncbi:DUF6790 family protein [Paenibacillus oryzisoli]|uniref:DUF6790 family protein n=1 Tax=Paenibacillus oryzisoli TaxID=1850517 RepID=UPI003D2A026D